ncbi:hypothetical protein DBR43_07670 [Pedobacter sp. KBW06]|nr:hypothetical protein DBR43_07670 [Pedobacter sp. KBW06]
MTMYRLISEIQLKHLKEGITINPAASIQSIEAFERKIGFRLPEDFIEFYSVCNGFECEEHMFNVKKLEEITDFQVDYGSNWFHFSDYLVSSDFWSLRVFENRYEIFNVADVEIILTSSLKEFLERYLKGDIFEPEGLYYWHEEIRLK